VALAGAKQARLAPVIRRASLETIVCMYILLWGGKVSIKGIYAYISFLSIKKVPFE
jgi:hypothetical protein